MTCRERLHGNFLEVNMTKKTKSAVENQPIYQHTKGVVKDNAVMALLHDKLFRQRLRKNVKVKAVTNAKQNMLAIGLKSPMIKFLISEILSSGFSFQFQYKK